MKSNKIRGLFNYKSLNVLVEIILLYTSNCVTNTLEEFLCKKDFRYQDLMKRQMNEIRANNFAIIPKWRK